jgi:hypothetical protein
LYEIHTLLPGCYAGHSSFPLVVRKLFVSLFRRLYILDALESQ